MKKLHRIALVLALALIVSALSGFALATTYVECTGGRCNVRNSPSLNGKDLWTLVRGERVPYLGVSSTDERGVTWYKVEYYSYGTGWVSSRYAKLTGGGGSTPAYGTVMGTGGSSNIRTKPNLSASVLGSLPKGKSADYLGSVSVDDRGVPWYYISYNGTTGWVSSRYTTLYY